MPTIEEENVFDHLDSTFSKDHLDLGIPSRSPTPTDKSYSLGDVIYYPFRTSLGVWQWASHNVEENVIAPVANRISSSMINPTNLSIVLWNYIKSMTPQRARDLTRIISIAITNSLGLLQADESLTFSRMNKQLREDTAKFISSEHGQTLVVDSVACISKTAAALNTPEMKIAGAQVTKTILDSLELIASKEGQQVIQSTADAAGSFIELVASPESTIFLTEVRIYGWIARLLYFSHCGFFMSRLPRMSVMHLILNIVNGPPIRPIERPMTTSRKTPHRRKRHFLLDRGKWKMNTGVR